MKTYLGRLFGVVVVLLNCSGKDMGSNHAWENYFLLINWGLRQLDS